MPRFKDREDAALQVAQMLGSSAHQPKVIILGLPRGGVALAYAVARELDVGWEVINVRKIGHPRNPEVAVGAIAEGGILVLDSAAIAMYGIDEDILQQHIDQERELVQERIVRYRGGADLSLGGNTVIVVDDGIATGWTMQAAIMSAKKFGAYRTIVAVPVAAADSVERLREVADEVMVIDIPKVFWAVGYHYRHFEQVRDEDVVRLLRSRQDEA
jgi:putative phosphoribosyl transferase